MNILAFSRLWRSLWAVSKIEGSAASGVYPAGEVQWHFSCGFDFRHDCHLQPVLQSWGVIGGSCESYGFFLAWGQPFRGCGVLMIAICGRFCTPGWVIVGSCGGYGFFMAWDWPFRGFGGFPLWVLFGFGLALSGLWGAYGLC